MASKTATIKAVVLGDVDNFKKGMQDVGESAQEAGGKVSRDLGGGFDKLGDAGGSAEQKFIGLKDSITGTQDVMQGLRTGSVTTLAMGLADLGGAVENLWAGFGKTITALWGKITATGADTAATATNTGATIGQRIATTATTIATKAHAAAQWLLNTALSANPIVLVVIALAALVAGFVIAYKNVGWFRDIVDSVARFFTDTLWPVLEGVAGFLGGVFAAQFDMARTAIGWVIDAAQWLVDKVNTYLMPVLSTLAGWIGTYFVTQFDVARIAVGWVIDAFQWLWDKAVAVHGGVVATIDKLVGWFGGLAGRISAVTGGMWDGIKDAFRSAINWVIDKWNGLNFPGISVGGVQVAPGFGTPDIARFAQGGLVKGGRGGVLGMIGEGASDELIVPLDRAGGAAGLGTTINITVVSPVGASSRDIGRELQRHLNEYARAS